MSKSTGNFLTLTQAIDKFSADGTFSFFLIYLAPVLCFVSSLFPLMTSIVTLLCFVETWETSCVHLEQITVYFHSAHNITLNYAINIVYPSVKDNWKTPHLHKMAEVLILGASSHCICQILYTALCSSESLYNNLLCVL